MRKLQADFMEFPATSLGDWKCGDYKMLEASLASEYLKEVLPTKARIRRQARIAHGRKPTSWFFGEAYIATRVPHEAGWYSSFKWLTSRRWTAHRGIDEGRHRQFQDALRVLGDLKKLRSAPEV